MILETATTHAARAVRPRGRASSSASSARSARARSTTPTSTSSTRAARAGASRKASSSRGSFSIDQGVGVRAVSRREDRLRLFRRHLRSALLDAARKATRAIAAGGPGAPRQGRRAASSPAPLAVRADRPDRHARRDATRSRCSRSSSSMRARARPARHAGDGGPRRRVRRGAGRARDGTLAADVRPLVRLSVTVIAEQNGRREQRLRRRRRALRLRATSPTTCSTSYADEAVRAGAGQPRSAPGAGRRR